MKTPLLAAFLLLSSATLLHAQTASTAKTKTKPGTSTEASKTKTKTTTPAPAPKPVALSPAAETQAETRANGLTENMQKALGLNPQQVEKVRLINANSVRAVETARLTYRQDVRKMAQVVDDIGQSRLSALKDVLSPAQFDKYQRKREQKMGVPSTQGVQGNPAPGLPGGE